MKTKEIIYLHPHFTISGGAGKFVLESGKRLAQKGYSVIVISIKNNELIIKNYRKYIYFIELGGPISSSIWFWIEFPIIYWKIHKILSKYKDFILFPQVFPANWWGFIYKLLNPKIKLIWMCHDPSSYIHSEYWIKSIFSRYKLILAYILRPIFSTCDIFLAQTCDAIIVSSLFIKNRAIEVYNFNSSKVKLIYLGYDTRVFRPSGIKKKNHILIVCRLSKFKKVDLLINAFSYMQQQGNKNFTLHIVGDGEERNNLEQLAYKLKVGKKVAFYGDITNVQDLVKIYQEARVFVSCSIEEPFGIVIVEAMACGTPIIAVNKGGPLEIVVNNQTGYLIEGDNHILLAKTLIKLLGNSELLQAMSVNSIERAQKFTWDQNASELIKELNALQS